MASGSLTDCGTTLPSSASIAVLIATATWAGPVPADEHFRPSPECLRAELAEAVLGLAAERHERMLGVDHRLHDAGVAALRGDAVELLVHGDRIGGDLLRGRVIPLADTSTISQFLPVACERLVDAVMAVGVDRGAGDAAHLEDLAAIRDVA